MMNWHFIGKHHMKSNARFFLQLAFVCAGLVICVKMAHAQMGGGSGSSGGGGAYDTSMDNPFLKKKAPSPGPSASAAAKPGASKSTSDKDTRFLSDAGASFGWEVKTGSAAETKAKDAKTKQIATRLVASYSKLAKELTDLASKKGRSISIEGVKAQAIGGDGYDQRYLNLVQQDHQQSVAAFRKAAQSADDPDIRAWAKKTLPVLQQNQAAAK